MTRVRWTLSVEAAQAIREAINFCTETGVCGKAFREQILKAETELPKPEHEQCADCVDAEEDLDAEFHSTPCGSHCVDCMAEHVKQCGVCAAQFPELVNEEEGGDNARG